MRDRLNDVVKFREAFRPYAASVLAEHVPAYFDLTVDDPFMLIVADVRHEHRDAIPSVVHVDGTCRIQSVPPGRPDRFERLLREFQATTGVPMVLNTSFNIRVSPSWRPRAMPSTASSCATSTRCMSRATGW